MTGQSFTPTIDQLRALSILADTGRFGDRRNWNKVGRLQTGINSLPATLQLQLTVPGTPHLTSAGEELARHAKNAVDAVDSFLSACDDLRSDTNALRVGCLPSHADLVALAAKSLGMETRVKLDITEHHRAMRGADLLHAVGLQRLNIAIVPSGKVPDGHEALHLYSWSLQVVVPEDHRLFGARQCDVDDLRNEPLLAAPRGHLSRAQLDAIGLIELAFETDSTDAIVALGRVGWGIAIVPDDALPIRTNNSHLVDQWPILHHRGDPVGGSFDAVFRSDTPPGSPTRRLVEAIAAQCSELGIIRPKRSDVYLMSSAAKNLHDSAENEPDSCDPESPEVNAS